MHDVQPDGVNVLEIGIELRRIADRVRTIGPAKTVGAGVVRDSGQRVVVIVVVWILVDASVGFAEQLHVGVDVIDTVAVNVGLAHEATVVNVAGIVGSIVKVVARRVAGECGRAVA